MGGTHEFLEDPRNEHVLIYINGDFFPRHEAKVSVFDSAFLVGDGLWESFRLHNGKLAFVSEHLHRLKANLKALDYDLGRSPEALIDEIYKTVRANKMHTDVHIRMMITRGTKKSPSQDPRTSISGPTIVIIAEYKMPSRQAQEGIRLFTVHVRRGRPDVQDPKLHPHSKLNCVISCIQAIKAGVDEALMLDPQGFVSTCNSTNFFIVANNQVWTSTGQYCLNGITRGNMIELCRKNRIDVFEKNFSLIDVYGADEAFVTGTFGSVAYVSEVDGRVIGDGKMGPVTRRLMDLYRALLEDECPSTNG
ncbi:aminotransferase, class IV [Olavius sp. associated proteobacterium Delta 1]|nr:aminotransferase, class IV [Olavius sp. associated proteobacterium Delta 1]